MLICFYLTYRAPDGCSHDLLHQKNVSPYPNRAADGCSQEMMKNKKNYFVSGSLAGSIRPSSGYAFVDIQKWAERAACSHKIKGNIEILEKREIIKKFLDKTFLNAIN